MGNSLIRIKNVFILKKKMYIVETYHFEWVQIFCLINCASPKLGQLVSSIKWDNPDFNTDVNVKIIPFFFSSTAFFSSLYFRLLVSFFSYVVDVNKNCRTLFSLPQLLFLFGFFWFLSLAATLVFDWDSSLYCLIVFLSFSQDFIVHCHRGSFYPIGFVFNFLETLAETSNLQGF